MEGRVTRGCRLSGLRRWIVLALAVLAARAGGGSLAAELDEVFGRIPDRIVAASTNSDFAFNRLATLCDTFGPRLSGSTNLEAAIDWVLRELRSDGFENARGEEVMVPHWVRGEESAELIEPRAHRMAMLGLGGSVGTPPEGITAEVLVVDGFEDLQRRASEATNRIVLFDLPFTDYGTTVSIRVRGAIEAARLGAKASLIRSVGSYSMQTPHTGMMRYDPAVSRIPHAAITIEDAAMLHRMQKRGQRVVVRLKMDARDLPQAKSRNVVAEIPGREHPEEIVLVSGHIDSWDVGQGAMDDGGGVLIAWESLRVIKKLKLQPRRTLRLVLWTNEENGVAGARAYREAHKAELPNHVLAIESDRGPFTPKGFAFTGGNLAMGYVRQFSRLLAPLNAAYIESGADGTDILSLIPDGVPCMDLLVEPSKYFWFHHTHADTVDKLNSADLNLGIAAVAVMAYAVADYPVRLPR